MGQDEPVTLRDVLIAFSDPMIQKPDWFYKAMAEAIMAERQTGHSQPDRGEDE